MDNQSQSRPLFGGSNTPSNTETLFLKYRPQTQATQTTFNFILAFVAKKSGLCQEAVQSARDVLSEYLTDEEFKDIEDLMDFQKKEEIDDMLGTYLSLEDMRLEQEIVYDATDIILEDLKDEDLKDFEKKEEIEDVLGTCLSSEEFNELVDLASLRQFTLNSAFRTTTTCYDNLGKAERTKVWRNFFKRLRLIGEGNIDYDTVESYVEELAEYEMNGRQIRNAITTARQLAQFKKKPMTWGHLRHVIKVAEKFDNYLNGVHEEMSDDLMARGEGIR